MPDIVANLLRLSSEAADVDDLLEPALDLALTATKAEAVAVVSPTLPDWSVLAARGVAKSAVPVELAAEALEHDDVAAADRWLAIPLVSRRGARSESIEPPYVLLVRGNAPTGAGVRGCDWIGGCAGGRRATRTSAARASADCKPFSTSRTNGIKPTKWKRCSCAWPKPPRGCSRPIEPAFSCGTNRRARSSAGRRSACPVANCGYPMMPASSGR